MQNQEPIDQEYWETEPQQYEGVSQTARILSVVSKLTTFVIVFAIAAGAGTWYYANQKSVHETGRRATKPGWWFVWAFGADADDVARFVNTIESQSQQQTHDFQSVHDYAKDYMNSGSR